MKSIRLITTFVWMLGNALNGFAQTDTIPLYFDIGGYALNSEQEEMLTRKMNALGTGPYTLHIIGSTDFLGSAASNQILSENRAESIVQFVNAHYPTRFNKLIYQGIGEMAGDESTDGLDRGVRHHRRTMLLISSEGAAETPIAQLGSPISPPADPASLLNLKQLKVGEKIVLENLQFQPGRHILREFSIPTLKKLEQLLKNNPNLEIEIRGHVCCGEKIGELDAIDIDTKEFKLSTNRARAVYDYLIKNGIAAERLSYRGFAFDAPLFYPETSRSDEQKNRRVEIKVIKK